MKNTFKEIGIFLCILAGTILLAVAVFFIYLNYEGPKTRKQEDSLRIINKLKETPSPSNYSDEDIPDVEPIIYDDTHLDEEYTTGEEKLRK